VVVVEVLVDQVLHDDEDDDLLDDEVVLVDHEGVVEEQVGSTMPYRVSFLSSKDLLY
jgi:hypothetical protein